MSTPLPEPDAQAMQAYLDRCMTLLVRLDGLLPRPALNEAHRLMDHGEPSIGVEGLAWAVVREQVVLAPDVIAEMRALVLDPAELPADLDKHASG